MLLETETGGSAPLLYKAAERSMPDQAPAQALDRLAHFDDRKARVVELRYRTGRTVEEIADVLNVSVFSVYRDMRFAAAFLAWQLKFAPATQGTRSAGILRGDWLQVEEVFHKTCALPQELRSRFLANVPLELRGVVQELLRCESDGAKEGGGAEDAIFRTMESAAALFSRPPRQVGQ